MTFAEDSAAQKALVADTASQAQAYLDALISVTNITFGNGFNIDNILPTAYDYASTPNVNFAAFTSASRPNVTTLSNEQPPVVPAFNFSSLPDPIALPVDDLLAPTNNFTFFEAPYQSILLDPLKVKLLDNLTNGGYGIETADEIALFNRARDREIEAMSSKIADAGRAMATRGFSLPPGELSIHIDRAYQDMQDKVSDVSRDITLARTKLFVENRQFTIREVREIEQVTLGYWNSVQERAVNVAKFSAEFGIMVYNALLARYKARLEAAKITSEVQFQRVQLEVERVKAYLEGYRGQIAAYEMNLRRIIETARLNVDVYRADIDSNRTANDALVARATLQAKVLEATIQQNIQISTMTIANARAKLEAAVKELEFKVGSVKFGAEKFYASLTALESTVNTLSVGTQTL